MSSEANYNYALHQKRTNSTLPKNNSKGGNSINAKDKVKTLSDYGAQSASGYGNKSSSQSMMKQSQLQSLAPISEPAEWAEVTSNTVNKNDDFDDVWAEFEDTQTQQVSQTQSQQQQVTQTQQSQQGQNQQQSTSLSSQSQSQTTTSTTRQPGGSYLAEYKRKKELKEKMEMRQIQQKKVQGLTSSPTGSDGSSGIKFRGVNTVTSNTGGSSISSQQKDSKNLGVSGSQPIASTLQNTQFSNLNSDMNSINNGNYDKGIVDQAPAKNSNYNFSSLSEASIKNQMNQNKNQLQDDNSDNDESDSLASPIDGLLPVGGGPADVKADESNSNSHSSSRNASKNNQNLKDNIDIKDNKMDSDTLNLNNQFGLDPLTVQLADSEAPPITQTDSQGTTEDLKTIPSQNQNSRTSDPGSDNYHSIMNDSGGVMNDSGGNLNISNRDDTSNVNLNMNSTLDTEYLGNTLKIDLMINSPQAQESEAGQQGPQENNIDNVVEASARKLESANSTDPAVEPKRNNLVMNDQESNFNLQTMQQTNGTTMSTAAETQNTQSQQGPNQQQTVFERYDVSDDSSDSDSSSSSSDGGDSDDGVNQSRLNRDHDESGDAHVPRVEVDLNLNNESVSESDSDNSSDGAIERFDVNDQTGDQVLVVNSTNVNDSGDFNMDHEEPAGTAILVASMSAMSENLEAQNIKNTSRSQISPDLQFIGIDDLNQDVEERVQQQVVDAANANAGASPGTSVEPSREVDEIDILESPIVVTTNKESGSQTKTQTETSDPSEKQQFTVLTAGSLNDGPGVEAGAGSGPTTRFLVPKSDSSSSDGNNESTNNVYKTYSQASAISAKSSGSAKWGIDLTENIESQDEPDTTDQLSKSMEKTTTEYVSKLMKQLESPYIGQEKEGVFDPPQHPKNNVMKPESVTVNVEEMRRKNEEAKKLAQEQAQAQAKANAQSQAKALLGGLSALSNLGSVPSPGVTGTGGGASSLLDAFQAGIDTIEAENCNIEKKDVKEDNDNDFIEFSSIVGAPGAGPGNGNGPSVENQITPLSPDSNGVSNTKASPEKDNHTSQTDEQRLDDLEDLDIGDLDAIIQMQAAKNRNNHHHTTNATNVSTSSPTNKDANIVEGVGIGGILGKNSGAANNEFSVSNVVKNKKNMFVSRNDVFDDAIRKRQKDAETAAQQKKDNDYMNNMKLRNASPVTNTSNDNMDSPDHDANGNNTGADGKEESPQNEIAEPTILPPSDNIGGSGGGGMSALSQYRASQNPEGKVPETEDERLDRLRKTLEAEKSGKEGGGGPGGITNSSNKNGGPGSASGPDQDQNSNTKQLGANNNLSEEDLLKESQERDMWEALDAERVKQEQENANKQKGTIQAKSDNSPINYTEFMNEYVLKEITPKRYLSIQDLRREGIGGGGSNSRAVVQSQTNNSTNTNRQLNGLLACCAPLLGLRSNGMSVLNDSLHEERDILWALTNTKYNPSECFIHFRALSSIYKKLTGAQPTSSVLMTGSHWEIIGFQGTTPDSDIRFGGVSNILHMLHLISYHSDIAISMQQLSQDGFQQFPLMCTSFGFSKVALEIVFPPTSDDPDVDLSGVQDAYVGARTRLFRYVNQRFSSEKNPLIKTCCRLHNALLFLFYKKWLEEKLTIMNFHATNVELEQLARKNPVSVIEEFDHCWTQQKLANNPASLGEFTDLETLQAQAHQQLSGGGGGGGYGGGGSSGSGGGGPNSRLDRYAA